MSLAIATLQLTTTCNHTKLISTANTLGTKIIKREMRITSLGVNLFSKGMFRVISYIIKKGKDKVKKGRLTASTN